VTVTRSMTPVTCWLCALALALSSQAAQAAPEWKINPDGTGAGSATTVSTLDVGGAGFVQILPDIDGPTFQFVEHGAYQVLKAFGTRDLTVTYSVSGTGDFWNPAALRFTSGAIDLYADPISDFASAASNYGADNGTHVARFSVFDGGVTPFGMVGVQASIVRWVFVCCGWKRSRCARQRHHGTGCLQRDNCAGRAAGLRGCLRHGRLRWPGLRRDAVRQFGFRLRGARRRLCVCQFCARTRDDRHDAGRPWVDLGGDEAPPVFLELTCECQAGFRLIFRLRR
jgi:opacity protein-like surface antigen